MKPEYGPTLGRLLAPRWHAASALARGAVIAAGVALVALLVAVALTLANTTYSRGGSVPFSFSYRSLYRVAPDPGGYVKVQRRGADGALEYSYAVDPLRLPRYSGELSGELPLYAAAYIRALARRDADFALVGEGKSLLQGEKPTAVNSVFGYNVFYTTVVDGRQMYGRDVLLLPARRGARAGVDIAMLSVPSISSGTNSPTEVATAGVLKRPLKTFSFG
jgi:hypothetical protein